MGDSGELNRFMHKGKKPSADTLGYSLDHANVEQLAHYNSDIIQKTRRDKVHALALFTDGVSAQLTVQKCIRPRGPATMRRGGPRRNPQTMKAEKSSSRGLWRYATLGPNPDCRWP